MGNVHMEATQINYREGNKKMSVAQAIKNAGSEITPEEKEWIDTIPVLASQEIIAPEFDAVEGVYAVGDLVIYQGGLYKFTTAHETAGAWNPEEVAAVKVSEELSSLESGLTNIRNRVVVAQSTTIGTYSQKINALVSAFESIPYDLQIRCFIEAGGNIIRFKSPSTFMDVVKYDISGGKMTINTIMMGLSSYMNKIEITANGTVITDISATEDSSVFTLYYN